MQIPENVRKQILDNLIIIGECFGKKGRAVDFVNRVAPYYKYTNELEQHMDKFKDWTCDRLFYQELNLLKVDDKQFKDFCSEYMNPVFVRKKRHCDENEVIDYEDLNPKCLKAINDGLGTVGFEVVSDTDRDGFYRVRNKVALPSGTIKNIIFAANKSKPDIVVDNVLENTVKILDAGDALVYEADIPEKGLSWTELSKWYEQYEPENTQKMLADRLFFSLDSPPEQLFFRAYCKFIQKNGLHLPALIPQVYLCYDPKTDKERFGNKVFEHQRMDFMFIINREHRVVIEIDGIQHYSDGKNIDGTYYKCADVNKYAQMMKAHREMVLDGYDVYRIGGKELYVEDGNEEPAIQVVFDFLERLFRKYRLMS